MKILIADDHDLFRDGLTLLIQSTIDCEIIQVGNYGSVKKICSDVDQLDLLLLDLDMPGANGFESIIDIRKDMPEANIIVISANETSEIATHLLNAGINGYIPKSSTSEIILQAIQLVISGGIYIPPIVLSSIGRAKINTVNFKNTEPFNQNKYTLTGREQEVLTLLVKGHSNKEIARDLSIAVTTVRTHTVSIFRTLNVSNRTQAGHVAIKTGLV